jgi:hypothetical protein
MMRIEYNRLIGSRETINQYFDLDYSRTPTGPLPLAWEG